MTDGWALLSTIFFQTGQWFLELSHAVRQYVLLETLAVVLTTVFLIRLGKHEWRQIRTALIFYAIYLISLPLEGVFRYTHNQMGLDVATVVGEVFFFVAVVNFGVLMVFDAIFPPLKIRVPRIMRDSLVIVLYVVLGLLLLMRFGVNIAGLLTTSAILTAVIGLSLQDTLGNLMSGLALQLESTVQVGDWIKVDTIIGKVKEIRWRHTAIETRTWDTVIIPNSRMMREQVTIFGRRELAPYQTRRQVSFNVDFRYAPSEVINTVNRALQNSPIENVAGDPQPHTILSDFRESYCQYTARYWLTNLDVDEPTDSTVRTRIFFALKRAGISLSLPAHSVFVTEESRKRKAQKMETELHRCEEQLRRVNLFATLTEAELRELAEMVHYAPFSPGEVIIRQGEEGHWLYVIMSGKVSVRIGAKNDAAGGSEREVAKLGPGDYFGEMSLMTGQPRAATVMALDRVECYRLDKDAFRRILESRPQIAEDISAIMAKRRVEYDEVREGLSRENRTLRMNAEQTNILRAIREFFSI